MVLRLRGGGWGIVLNIPGFSAISIEGPHPGYLIGQLYAAIYNKYPQLRTAKFDLFNQGRILDKKKTIMEYGISYQNN